LRQKLQAKGFPDTVVDAVLAELVREGCLSDARFSESYVRERSGKGFGALRIRQELRMRGIEADDGGAFREVDWDVLIERAYVKKYGNTVPDSLPEKAARQRFLAQRGFGHDQIRQLFRRLEGGG
jgi:regulatory protein